MILRLCLNEMVLQSSEHELSLRQRQSDGAGRILVNRRAAANLVNVDGPIRPGHLHHDPPLHPVPRLPDQADRSTPRFWTVSSTIAGWRVPWISTSRAVSGGRERGRYHCEREAPGAEMPEPATAHEPDRLAAIAYHVVLVRIVLTTAHLQADKSHRLAVTARSRCHAEAGRNQPGL